MYWLIIGVLMVLWIIGLLTSFNLGGLIHVLVVIAMLLVLHRVVSGPAEEIHKRGDGTQNAWKKS